MPIRREIAALTVILIVAGCAQPPERRPNSDTAARDLHAMPASSGTSQGDLKGLVGHWVCSSAPMPTGLFLYRTYDFRANGTFRSIDSMQEQPPVRVMEGSWSASEHMISVKYKTWRIGSEGDVVSSEGGIGYGFIDSTRTAFEATVTYSTGPIDFICGSSLDDIFQRRLVDVLERDIARHRSGG